MFAYVILAHERPDLVVRLARRIRRLSPESAVVVRYDARAGGCEWPVVDGVLFREHTTELQWGGWSLVEAMLTELADILDRLPGATHVVFISGRDYPVRDLAGWESEVAGYDAVMVREPMHFHPRWGRRRGYSGTEDAIRHRYRWFRIPLTGRSEVQRARLFTFAVRGAAWLTSHVRPLLYVRLLPRGRGLYVGIRRRWRGPQVYKGWQWVALSASSARLVLDSPLQPLWRRTLIPDESYVHTVLTDANVRVLDGAVSYTAWKSDAGTAHPNVLGLDDIEAARRSGSPFARKFDAHEVLDRIDDYLDSSTAAD